MNTIYTSFRPSFNFMMDLVVVQSDLYILIKHLKYLFLK
jgi:hypothetical protein